MKKFILSSTYIVFKNGLTQVCLEPSDSQINEYINTYKVYDSEDEALSDIPNLIVEQTPLLYNVFKDSEGIPIEIRNQYEL